jgi:pyridoxal phosphate enzyme (YggS family)
MKNVLTTTTLSERIARVREQIAGAAAGSGRASDDITLVAVSKTVDRSTIDEAYAAGLRRFGENRVQDAARKFELPLPADAELSMIGQLQSNKTGPAIKLFQRIESVDRLSLIDALDRHAMNAGIVLPVLLQVNVAGEEQKAGCAPNDAVSLAFDIDRRNHLRLDGLMTIAPLVEDPETVRPVFQALRNLRDELQKQLPQNELATLSMGMTNDFEMAIEEGATRVRIGRAIFG